MGCIYMFRDTGYDQGVKIGWASDDKKRFGVALSYTPRSIEYVARWDVEKNVLGGTHQKVEAAATQGLPRLNFENNGREWFALKPAEAIARVADNLGRKPSATDVVVQRRGRCLDDFRWPLHADRENYHDHKHVVWVYQENLTGRLKTRVIWEWQTPRERVRTYSRNGFKPLLAFTYRGPIASEGNQRVQGAWAEAMSLFGPGPAEEHYGWLHEVAQPTDLLGHYKTGGLQQIQQFGPTAPRPEGVKRSYNSRD